MASYYPSWCVDDRPPESLDFSKFDIVFYGAHTFYRKGFFKKNTHTWSSLRHSDFIWLSSLER